MPNKNGRQQTWQPEERIALRGLLDKLRGRLAAREIVLSDRRAPKQFEKQYMSWRPEERVALGALLHNFRDALVGLAAKESILSDQLPSFLDALRRCALSTATASKTPFFLSTDDTRALRDLLRELDPAIEIVEQAGLFGNPWTAAALHRNEVKNASVLTWLLDPKGGHGCGDLLLVDLLKLLNNQLPNRFPDRPSRHCLITSEECPDGSSASRVDIQIDDPAFFIIVEVKIDAPEQPEQLNRYCRIASERACGRPWVVVLLTPGGTPSKTAGDQSDHVVSVAWPTFAASLRRMAGRHSLDNGLSATAIPRFLHARFRRRGHLTGDYARQIWAT